MSAEPPIFRKILLIEQRSASMLPPDGSVDAAVSVPGRHTVACARIAAGVVLSVGGPLADFYVAHLTGYPAGPAASVAIAQVALGVVMSWFGIRRNSEGGSGVT